MTASEIIEKSRINGFSATNLTEYFEFKKSSDLKTVDENLELRTEIVDNLLSDFENEDIGLIRLLFDEELKCELETRRHDNLYQLSFYLYELGNLKDVYRIYTAKFDAKNMDVGTSLDSEMLYMNHKIEEVIEFVKNDNSNTNPKVLETLTDLKKYPNYESEETYNIFINGYFYGHKSELEEKGIKSGGKYGNKKTEVLKKLIVYFYAWLLFTIIISILMLTVYIWKGEDINWLNALIGYGIIIPLTLVVRYYVNKQKNVG